MALMKTILVVDDEPQIVQVVRDYLEHGGFTVVTAAEGSTALRVAATQHPDLVILDLALPGIDGLDVTRSLRRNGTVPIIMLTARTDESDKLVGLELGADDYLTKPFSPKELVARVRSVLRRSEAARGPAGRAWPRAAALVAAGRALAADPAASMGPDRTAVHVAICRVYRGRVPPACRGAHRRRPAGRDRRRSASCTAPGAVRRHCRPHPVRDPHHSRQPAVSRDGRQPGRYRRRCRPDRGR